MTNSESDLPDSEPVGDLFVEEGEDRVWAWTGTHDRAAAVSFARDQYEIEGPVNVKTIRARIDRGPDDQSPDGEWLTPDPAGPFTFWQVTGEGHRDWEDGDEFRV